MTITGRQVARLRRAAAAKRTAEQAADAKRSAFLEAIRQTRAEGATLQEIGVALGVSRQYVHQLIADLEGPSNPSRPG